MTESEDIDFIRQAKAGNSKAFEALVRKHYTFIYKVAFKWCGNKEDAEDISQEVCVKIARKINSFNESAAFQTWLYRITINSAKDLALKRTRDRNKESEYLVQEKEKLVQQEEKKVADTLLTLLESLPVKLRDAALLVYSEGLNHKEAASVLNCAETTISWRVFQAKKKLKKLLENGEFK